MKLNNIKNNYFFNIDYLNNICKELNLKTEAINFVAKKITTTKFGLRQALVRATYKKDNKNSQCKLLIFENSKGDIKLSVRKGFMVSFAQDIYSLNKKIK